jgi:hypothetical protein
MTTPISLNLNISEEGHIDELFNTMAKKANKMLVVDCVSYQFFDDEDTFFKDLMDFKEELSLEQFCLKYYDEGNTYGCVLLSRLNHPSIHLYNVNKAKLLSFDIKILNRL